MVWFEGRLIGKPRDLNEAAAFLRAFSGRTQLVFSGVALSLPGQPLATRVISSSVLFHELSDATINAYLERTKPLDRAGAYDIDENGDLLIASYSGSYTNIMGLPLEVVTDWLCANNLITSD
jgi:septum formation protein